MQVLAILRTLPSATPDRLGPLVKPEAQHVWDMHLGGVLRAAHFLQAPGAPFPMGVSLMLEVDNPDQAKRLIDALPMVIEGVILAEVLPLAPFTGYSALFADAQVRG